MDNTLTLVFPTALCTEDTLVYITVFILMGCYRSRLIHRMICVADHLTQNFGLLRLQIGVIATTVSCC
jgi:hypothetical protein